MHILVFKTNIDSAEAFKEIGSLLGSDQSILDWHIDKEDVDKVLRIESELNNTHTIISTISKAGFLCEELPD